MSIELSNLRKEWEHPSGVRRTVIDLPRFLAQQGDRICLVGHSGSGKTTLLNIIAGIVRPTAGSVIIGGQDLFALGESQRDFFRAQNIGYVFQTFNLLQSLTAMENVMIAASFAGMGLKEARTQGTELLSRVGLSHQNDTKPAKMSVGEQQRVAIARALINKPQIVLADEPTANLDQENGTEVLELLKETTVEANSILLLVTHDLEVQNRFDDVRILAEISHDAASTD